jgi:menaquinone-dependent protoporphyrinogen oxidase
MSRALIVYASRHGSTAGIAQRIAQVMRTEGIDAVLADAADLPDPKPYDACVVGAGVYMGSWVKEGLAYLDANAPTLANLPVWLFSSGPLRGSSKDSDGAEVDPIESALGPREGPGSGGRRKVEVLATLIHPRDHRVFHGAFDPSDPPKAMSERLVRMMPGSGKILPEGDFRDWPEIEAWAREIANSIKEEVPVG